MASLFELEKPPFGQLTKGKSFKGDVDATATLTADDCIEKILESGPDGNITLTLPSAAKIVEKLGQQALLGQTFELTIINTASSGTKTVTLAAPNPAAGSAVVGSGAVPIATSGTFIGRVEDPLKGQEAVAFYRK